MSFNQVSGNPTSHRYAKPLTLIVLLGSREVGDTQTDLFKYVGICMYFCNDNENLYFE